MRFIKNILTFVLIMSFVVSFLYIPSFGNASQIPEKSTWKIEANSQFQYNPAIKALDGDAKTYWHSNYEVVDNQAVNPDIPPFYIYLTLPYETVFSGVDITPRAASGAQINEISVYVSDNAANDAGDTSWVLVSENVALETPAVGDQTPLTVDFGTNVKAKKMMLAITKTSNDYGTIAEIDLKEKNIMYPVAPASELLIFNSIKNDDSVISDKSEWEISVNSNLGNSIEKVIDGIVAEDNYWHSSYVSTGPEVTYHDVPPYYIYLTFPEKTVISKLDIIPRQDSKNGCPLELSVFASLEENAEEDTMILLEKDLKYEEGYIGRVVDFAGNIVVRKLLIKITGSNGGYGCLSEINITGYDETKKYSALETYIDTSEYVKRYKISPNFFSIESDYTGIWANNRIENMLDGSGKTYWQTDSLAGKNIYPTITVDMQEEYILSELEYYPRQTNDYHGHWRKFTLQVSTNGESYDTIGVYTMEERLDRELIKLPKAVRCRYVRFLEITGNYNYVGGAELYFYQNWEGYNDYNTRYGGTFQLEYGSEEIFCEQGANPGTYTLDGPLIVKNGWTFVPIKSFVNELIYKGKATEEISADLKKITVSLNDGVKTFTLQENNHFVYSDDNNYGDVRYTMYALPFVKDDVFYAPLHFLCEIIGYEASMDYESGILTLVKEDFNMYDTVEWIDPAKEFSYYTVNYDLGDAGVIEGGKVSDSVKIGEGLLLPYVKTGVDCKFEGWYYPGRIKKLAGYENEAYTPGSDVTLYAAYSVIDNLDSIKEEAIARLKETDIEIYRTAQRKIIEAIISKAESDILAADTKDEIEELYNIAKAEIDAVETDEEMTKAEDETGLKLTVTAMEGNVTMNGEPVIGTVTVAAGKEVNLKAIPNEGTGVFKAWIDGTTKKILSTNTEYKFNIYSKRHIIALFTDSSMDNEVFTSFISRNNQYIKYLFVPEGTDTNSIAPDEKAAYASGYTFKGWKPALGVINKDTDYRGIYEKDTDIYTITVKNGKELDNGDEFTAEYNESYTVKANKPAKGLVFAGWKLNGHIVSYEEIYSFAVFGDIELEATYADSLVKKPVVVMLDADKKVQGKYNIASFLGTTYVPENATYVESGILYIKTKVDSGALVMSNLGKTADGKTYKRTISSAETMFKLSANYTELGITARGYLIYLDSDGNKKTIYTDISYIVDEDIETENGSIDEDIDMDL